MPTLLVLSMLFQIVCVVHVIKTGRERIWLWVILLFSGLGCAVYFAVEILPEIYQSRTGRVATTQILKAIDPHRDLKRLAEQLTISDNVENKVNLARECVEAKFYDEAIGLYQKSLTGIYETDPNILLELSVALFRKGDFAKTKETLNHLIVANPDFKSQEGHLLYARTLEGLQDNETALEEYKVLASYYSGLEARCRYGLLLKKLGHTERAREIFTDLLSVAKKMPRHARQLQKEWIDIARQQLT